MADQGAVAGKDTTDGLAAEVKASADRITGAIARAVLLIVGGLAGLPAATWAGQVTAGHISDQTVINSAEAIAGAAAVGFAVVLLSSAIFAFVLAPLIGFLLEANTP